MRLDGQLDHQCEEVRPTALPPAFRNIPDELKSLPRWVVWAHTPRDGEWKKVPYTAVNPTRCASSTDPETWGTYEAALATYMTQVVRLDGVGFMLDGSGYVAVDLDHVIVDGQLEREAAQIIETIDSYTEISPSGTGIRIMARGSLPPGWNKTKKYTVPIELYDSARYVTITGHRWSSTRAAVAERTVEIAGVHRTVAATINASTGHNPAPAPAGPTLGDADVLRRAMSAKNGAKFTALWNGDTSHHNGDDSDADLALCSYLAFWTRRNAEQMDRLFRQSKLMRPKWDSPRPGGTSGSKTIEVAVQRSDVYMATHADAQQEWVIIRDAVIEASWRWRGKAGATDWKVIVAHLVIAKKFGRLIYPAAVRTVADIAGVSASSVTEAHKRLRNRGWLKLIAEADDRDANIWRLRLGQSRDGNVNHSNTPISARGLTGVRLDDETVTEEPPLTGLAAGCPTRAQLKALMEMGPLTDAERSRRYRDRKRDLSRSVDGSDRLPVTLAEDAFYGRGGLGPVTQKIALSLGKTPVRVEVLAVLHDKVTSGTIRYHLRKLRRCGLAIRVRGGWVVGQRDPREVAKELHVSGTLARKRAQHQDEREVWATKRKAKNTISAERLSIPVLLDTQLRDTTRA